MACCSASSTYTRDGRPFKIVYGSSSVQGGFVADVLEVRAQYCTRGVRWLRQCRRCSVHKAVHAERDGRVSSTYRNELLSNYAHRVTLQFAGLRVNSQVAGAAASIEDVFAFIPCDGVFGLGWPQLAIGDVVPPFQNVMQSLDAPLYTVWLDRYCVHAKRIVVHRDTRANGLQLRKAERRRRSWPHHVRRARLAQLRS